MLVFVLKEVISPQNSCYFLIMIRCEGNNSALLPSIFRERITYVYDVLKMNVTYKDYLSLNTIFENGLFNVNGQTVV